MNSTLQAVLARFGGDKDAAMDYCYDVALCYPHLRSEYRSILFEIARMEKTRRIIACASYARR